MSLVYSESAVKKKPFFSSGEPEPRLKEGELFIYVTQTGQHIVVGYEKTPVSNAFINKNKINYRIRMDAGPFEYTLGRDFYTRDHRKQLRVDIRLKLDIEDAVKLYNAKVQKVEDQLDTIVPSYIANLVSSYEIEDIILLQQRLSDINVFPGLTSEIRSLGLRVASYNAIVDKDEMEKALDRERRQKEHQREQEKEDAKHQTELKYAVETADAIYGSQSYTQLVDYYTGQLEKSGNPQLVLSTIRDENVRTYIKETWKQTGLLIEEPKASRTNNDLDDLLSEINQEK